MVILDVAAKLAMAMPDATEGARHGARTFFAEKKAFMWERLFSKADIRRFGNETPPDGPIVAVRVADPDEKELILGSEIPGFFTIPHFVGYAAILILRRAVVRSDLKAAIVDAWFAVARPRLAREHAKT